MLVIQLDKSESNLLHDIFETSINYINNIDSDCEHLLNLKKWLKDEGMRLIDSILSRKLDKNTEEYWFCRIDYRMKNAIEDGLKFNDYRGMYLGYLDIVYDLDDKLNNVKNSIWKDWNKKMNSFKVVVNDMMGEKNSYGYFAGEVYEVVDYSAISYKVISPNDKVGWQIYHGHCRKCLNETK